MITFKDRHDAGRRLGVELMRLRDEHPVVLGLPRGGVPVAAEVARALDAPLDVLLVRKLGVPFQPELAMGALGEGGIAVYNDDVLRHAGIDRDELATVQRRESEELARRATRYRGTRPPLELTGRVALVVDDGVATGATARAACLVARAHGALRVIMAAPVGAHDSVRLLEQVADEVICLAVVDPGMFFGVGQFYLDFSQTSDGEVIQLLESGGTLASAGSTPDPTIHFDLGTVTLTGDLAMPDGARGLVIFAHGSGSSRFSSRNRHVARVLNEAGFGTLLFDLLTSEEELDRRLVFDIPLLAARLHAVALQVRGRAEWIGYFGASTGAAAALRAATEPGADVAAIVSRGGRPDLAMERLGSVRPPTLLIVGGHDYQVIELNRLAQAELHCPSELAIVPGATHLFEEPGALDAVAELARAWFGTHGGAVGTSAGGSGSGESPR